MIFLERNLRLSPFSPVKILCHFQRLSSEPDLGPVTVNIDLANICNHRCIWCHSSNYQSEQPYCMDPGVFQNLVNSLVKLKTKAIILTGGGEPTCHPSFNRILEIAFNAGLEVALVTNGAWLDNVSMDLLYRLRYLRISLDAGSEPTHTRLHRPRNPDCGWEKILENIAVVCRRKPEGLTVGVGYLLHDLNISETPSIARVLKELKVDYLQIRPLKRPYGKGNAATVAQTYRTVKRLESPDFQIFEVGDKYRAEAYPTERCHLLPLICNIGPRGDIYACCELKGRSDCSYGSLQEKPFEEIWNSQRRHDIMNRMMPKACPKCKFSLMNVMIEEIMLKDRLHLNFL